MKVFGLSVGVFVLFIVLLFSMTAFGFAWKYFWAAPAGKTEAQVQIQSAPSRIAAYNHFFDACSAVQGLDVAIDTQFDQLGQTTDNKDRSRIQSNIAGVTAERSRAVAKYNTDARKDYTIGQFRDSDLPYQLPLTHEKGKVVSCGN